MRPAYDPRVAPLYAGETPAAVVVDTSDGYTFWRGGDGALFTVATAQAFAAMRNDAAGRPGYPSYRHQVFTLAPYPACTCGTGPGPMAFSSHWADCPTRG